MNRPFQIDEPPRPPKFAEDLGLARDAIVFVVGCGGSLVLIAGLAMHFTGPAHPDASTGLDGLVAFLVLFLGMAACGARLIAMRFRPREGAVKGRELAIHPEDLWDRELDGPPDFHPPFPLDDEFD